MGSIALLQLVTEYLTTHDDGRFLSKLTVLVVGLPLVVAWASAFTRWWTAERRNGSIVALAVGAFVSGALFAALLSAVRLVGLSIERLQPHTGAWGAIDVMRIGFTMGLTNFALWALGFVFPFAAEDARVRALESEKLRTEAELARLRAHLEPHFLLNTLSAVSGLVTEDPRLARRMLATLGELLRDSLRSNSETQTLDEQLAWLRRYAQILEVRHAGQLEFRWETEADVNAAELPWLLLQPLVENAVKHGALMRRGGGNVTVTTKREGEKLVCIVEDNGPGVPAGETRAGAFGLASVRRRLALRYGDDASLELESSPSGTRSIVEMPYHE
ncbi:MAG: hypothetical protein JWO86_3049 [Myxococcaceae bacterium]|jgi:signal transduction histidine kinase|nr:hypothetical protein [Myxococcaceae bacterium]MEA2752014.1 two-component system, LytTR family, sensor kinase [Myxococcales bacterium]